VSIRDNSRREVARRSKACGDQIANAHPRRHRSVLDSAFRFQRCFPAIADAPKRLDGIVLVLFHESAFLIRKREHLEDTITSRDEVATERAKFPTTERFVKLTDGRATTGTDLGHETFGPLCPGESEDAIARSSPSPDILTRRFSSNKPPAFRCDEDESLSLENLTWRPRRARDR
jgi:hypothetical protein